MKKDVVKEFLHTHKQSLPADDFTHTLLRKLDTLPMPAMEQPRGLPIYKLAAAWLPMVGVSAGIVVLWLLGGWRVFVADESSIMFHGINLVQMALWVAVSWLLTLAGVAGSRTHGEIVAGWEVK